MTEAGPIGPDELTLVRRQYDGGRVVMTDANAFAMRRPGQSVLWAGRPAACSLTCAVLVCRRSRS